MFTHYFDYLHILKERRRLRLLSLLSFLDQLPKDDVTKLSIKFYEKYPFFKNNDSIVEFLKKVEKENSLDECLILSLEEFMDNFSKV